MGHILAPIPVVHSTLYYNLEGSGLRKRKKGINNIVFRIKIISKHLVVSEKSATFVEEKREI
jgi:hypothetical protein